MSAQPTPVRVDPEALLRGRGVRVTAQRRLLLGLLVEHEGQHWTADELWTALRQELPEVARATAYNVLEELVRVGLAEELATGDGGHRYGLRLVSHHHFVCDRCRRWFDVQPAGVQGVRLGGGAQAGHRVERVEVTLRGLCADCLAASG
jgi:Fe2+ or Zn2+ uptake regulation protein